MTTKNGPLSNTLEGNYENGKKINPGLALIGLLGTGRFLVRPARPKNVYVGS